jgi:type IV pilus assembly protein PilQ
MPAPLSLVFGSERALNSGRIKRVTIQSRMWSLIVLLRRRVPLVCWVALAACTTSSPGSKPASSATAANGSKPAVSAPKAGGPSTHEAEIDAVFALAKKNRWADAELKASALYEMDPQDPAVQRVYSWVTKQHELRENQKLEDRIREIDANNSIYNPSIPDLLAEDKDRGLPPRKDVRDAVDRIESTPYIPGSYGKVIRRKGMLFDLETEQGRMAKLLDKEISVHLDDVTLQAIIFKVGQDEGINFVADKALPAFAQKLSYNLDKVKLREFLNYVARNLDVQFQVGNDLIWVIDAKDPKRLQEETRFYRLRKGFVLPAMLGGGEAELTKQFNPQNQSQIVAITEKQKINRFVNDGAPETPAIERAIKEFAGTNVTYQIDYERNLIVARGTRERLEVLEKIIQEFDKPIQQVLIEARFVTLSQPAFLQLGVLWETGRSFSATRLPNDFTGLVNPASVPGLGLGIQQTFTNVLNSATLTATISALEQSGESQTLSAPRLTVINNRPASISDGKVQYYYEEYTVASTVQQYYSAASFVPAGKPTKVTSGAELDVMASISGDGKSILLALRPRVNTDVQLVKFATVSQYNGGTSGNNLQSTFDIMLPQYRTEELATRAVVKSGQTVVMGGVLEREQTTFVESVPVLGSLPILGPLFRRRSEIDRPRYLLIFVTATILSETGEFVIYDDEEK